MEWCCRRPPRSVVAVTQKDSSILQSGGQRLEGGLPLVWSEHLKGATLNNEVKRTRTDRRIHDAADHVLQCTARPLKTWAQDTLGFSGPSFPSLCESQRDGRNIEGNHSQTCFGKKPRLLRYPATSTENALHDMPIHELN
jgi:hypothetical protein